MNYQENFIYYNTKQRQIEKSKTNLLISLLIVLLLLVMSALLYNYFVYERNRDEPVITNPLSNEVKQESLKAQSLEVVTSNAEQLNLPKKETLVQESIVSVETARKKEAVLPLVNGELTKDNNLLKQKINPIPIIPNETTTLLKDKDSIVTQKTIENTVDKTLATNTSTQEIQIVKEIILEKELINQKVNSETLTTSDINTTKNAKMTIPPKEELPQELFYAHTVKTGENINTISMKYYGTTDNYVQIVEANQNLENPNNLSIGEEILIPILDETSEYFHILSF